MRNPMLVLLLPLVSSGSLLAQPPDLDAASASRFAALALACVHQEYPNKIAHTLQSDEDVAPPRELTPAFYGCYDWHSSVHGHWLLARLARSLPEAAFAARARAALAVSLTPERIAGEVDYLLAEGRVSFERPYGLAWLLQLAAELREWDDPQARHWAAVLEPLETAAAERLAAWLPKLDYPIRIGEHAQTAFAFGLARDWAVAAGDVRLLDLLDERSRHFHLADRDCPLAYEPGGQDFLSPCLAEADLMRRLLRGDEFAPWLASFLPGIPLDGDAGWLPVAVVSDPSDPKLAHLDGLNLSRAWMLEGIAAALPADDPRRAALLAAATSHREAGLAAVTGEHYEGGHWLGSFAVYLVTARGSSPAGRLTDGSDEGPGAPTPGIEVRLGEGVVEEALAGRLLVLLATDGSREPRDQLGWGLDSAQAFGVDVEGWQAGETRRVDATTLGYPLRSLAGLPAGEYSVQAVLHRYETFRRAVGPPVSLPASWAAGQQWNREPGNLLSTPRRVRWDPDAPQPLELTLSEVIPPVEPPRDTLYVRHLEMRSELLSQFWGREMKLGAHVLVPEGFDEHPEARYPLMLFHGHFPADFGGFRTEPPDPDLECERAERFDVDCYNRVEQQEAYDFYRRWSAPDFPRFLVVEVQHANPFYDDSYAVNSANLGPYGDAIHHELLPAIEERFRGIGEGWARFTYGGSTGGWEALASQVFYPEEFNGAFVACPDPVDFREYVTVDIYEDGNAYFRDGAFLRLPRAGRRDARGHLDMTMESFNRLELVLGTKGRSGQQFDIWEAVFSPLGEDGYPRRLWDKETGEIDPEVAAAWRRYDLRHVLESGWATLGPQVAGKLHLYCGDMDNYYLNNAVYRMQEFLEATTDPPYGGVVDYGDRAEHCWNGDHENPNHVSRLRYNTMYLPLILERIEATAPAGADLESWRH